MSANAHIITNQSITIITDQPHTFSRASIPEQVFGEVVDALNDDDYDTALELLSPKQSLEAFFSDSGQVYISNGEVWCGERRVDTYVARRAVQFHREGLPAKPLLHFIERVQSNPSYRAVQELYSFLEAGNMPLTADGRFMAYKKVRRTDDGHLVDVFTGKFDNSPGTTVSIPRNEVDEDPERTCSHGLHVCSYDYLPRFGCGPWEAVVIVQVDPENVVAVPRDYNDTKMRVSAYTVVKELKNYREADVLAASSMWCSDDDFEEDDFEEDDWGT